jgi:hypothetical protein
LEKAITCGRKPSLVEENHDLLEEPSFVGKITTRWRNSSLVAENHQLVEKTIPCWRNPLLLAKTTTC